MKNLIWVQYHATYHRVFLKLRTAVRSTIDGQSSFSLFRALFCSNKQILFLVLISVKVGKSKNIVNEIAGHVIWRRSPLRTTQLSGDGHSDNFVKCHWVDNSSNVDAGINPIKRCKITEKYVSFVGLSLANMFCNFCFFCIKNKIFRNFQH